MEEYAVAGKKVMNALQQLPGLYLCQLGFSDLMLQIKKRERLQSVGEFGVCLSHVCPDIAVVVKKHMTQLSHQDSTLLFNVHGCLIYMSKIFFI